MAVQQVVIGAEQVAHLLALPEDHFNELKSARVSPAKLTRTLSAFANADGGDLFVGIDEDEQRSARTWNGFKSQEDANGHLQVFEEVSPFGTDFEAEFFRAEGQKGLVLHIFVRKSAAIRSARDGIVYKRIGPQNAPVNDPQSLEQLRRAKGLSSFETETIPAPLDTITNSEAIIDFMLSVIPTGEPEPWLRKQRLIVDDKVSVAGVLLFSDEPQALLPKRSAIKIYRYKSTEQEREQLVFTPETIEGHLYAQIYQAVSRTTELIESAAFLGEDGFTTVSYPPEALHEVITNAVLHRDYEILDDVHVRIFENRVEVESPGRLPGHITPANILDERLSRNGSVVRLVNKFPNPPNKDVGEGLNTAFAMMHKMNLKEPKIEERERSVKVTIKHELLASPEEQVVEYLKSHDRINNSTGRKLLNIDSESKMKKVFERLIAANEIEHFPGTAGRGYAYRIRGEPGEREAQLVEP
jgi:ATP-dependent DNA helicase RecG